MVRPFRPADQEAARRLILAGLQEHFGSLDPHYNEDLNDIYTSYPAQGHLFLVMETAAGLTGTAALLLGQAEAQVVRVSVAPEHRRQGIAQTLVSVLLAEARTRGISRVWMETNDDWHDALGLYRSLGFRPFDHRDGCIFMQILIDAQP